MIAHLVRPQSDVHRRDDSLLGLMYGLSNPKIQLLTRLHMQPNKMPQMAALQGAAHCIAWRWLCPLACTAEVNTVAAVRTAALRLQGT